MANGNLCPDGGLPVGIDGYGNNICSRYGTNGGGYRRGGGIRKVPVGGAQREMLPCCTQGPGYSYYWYTEGPPYGGQHGNDGQQYEWGEACVYNSVQHHNCTHGAYPLWFPDIMYCGMDIIQFGLTDGFLSVSCHCPWQACVEQGDTGRNPNAMGRDSEFWGAHRKGGKIRKRR
tara:strand:+ start:1109 stop:1630 length:522 start_codon:yes stop_codon:yes gene_type:complete